MMVRSAIISCIRSSYWFERYFCASMALRTSSPVTIAWPARPAQKADSWMRSEIRAKRVLSLSWSSTRRALYSTTSATALMSKWGSPCSSQRLRMYWTIFCSFSSVQSISTEKSARTLKSLENCSSSA